MGWQLSYALLNLEAMHFFKIGLSATVLAEGGDKRMVALLEILLFLVHVLVF